MNNTLFSALFALGVACAFISHPAYADGDASKGAKLYPTKCGTCHTLDSNKIGPMQRGIIGRKAGTAAGYDYSPALKASGLTWNEATIDKWLINPSALVAGTKMTFNLPDAKDRADIIAYLKSASTKK